LKADYITAVEDRPIMSVKYCFLVPVFHFWPKLQRGLDAIAEIIVTLYVGTVSSVSELRL